MFGALSWALAEEVFRYSGAGRVSSFMPAASRAVTGRPGARIRSSRLRLLATPPGLFQTPSSKAQTFANYLRGAICSIVDAMSRRRDCRNSEPFREDRPPGRDRVRPSPAAEAEISNIREELFVRLRSQAPPRLRPTIDAWEAEWPHSDRVPNVNGQRKYAHEVRKIARSILHDLDIAPAVEQLKRRPEVPVFPPGDPRN